ncbi:hypothetical protein F4775DRAFT_561644 [Biscogniauxia sp. FL1348]|nr:hypothetical protein F4775DRAFT_561644 [Biscogniauxia sp. FL1348]
MIGILFLIFSVSFSLSLAFSKRLMPPGGKGGTFYYLRKMTLLFFCFLLFSVFSSLFEEGFILIPSQSFLSSMVLFFPPSPFFAFFLALLSSPLTPYTYTSHSLSGLLLFPIILLVLHLVFSFKKKKHIYIL